MTPRDEAYQTALAGVTRELTRLQTHVALFLSRTPSRDWAATGSLLHVMTRLHECNRFLAGQPE